MQKMQISLKTVLINYSNLYIAKQAAKKVSGLQNSQLLFGVFFV
jgi:hypothetical protein